MPAAGSSSRISSGSVASTTPSSTHCRCPWASWPTRRSATAVRPTRLQHLVDDPALAARRVDPARRQPDVLTHRETVEHAGHLGLDADAEPRDLMRLQAGDVLAPEQDRSGGGLQLPGQQLEEVLLPAPLGPIRQRSSPSASEKLTSRTAWTPPKMMLRSRVSKQRYGHHAPPPRRLGSSARLGPLAASKTAAIGRDRRASAPAAFAPAIRQRDRDQPRGSTAQWQRSAPSTSRR